MGVHTHLSLVNGKYVQSPNLVLVPADRKTFPVRVQLDCECEDTHVVGAADKAQASEWCVLDEQLRQVEVGGGGGKKPSSARRDPRVSRTIMGGGASNPEQIAVDLTGAKLESGAGYTLVVKSYGVTASCDFVALHEPAEAKARKKPARKRKAKAKKKAVKRKVKRKAKAVKKKTKAKAKAKGKVVKKKAKAKTRAVKKKAKAKTRKVKRKAKAKTRKVKRRVRAKKK